MKIPRTTVGSKSAMFNYRLVHKKQIEFAGRTLKHRITVAWGATSAQKIMTELKGDTLRLIPQHYAPTEEQLNVREIELRLMNADIKTLIMPEDFLCEAAREWVAKVGDQLILKIKDFKPNQPLENKMFDLHVGHGKDSNDYSGVLVLANR